MRRLSAEVRQLREQRSQQRAFIRELKAKLALAQAEARSLREHADRANARPLQHTVRIGAAVSGSSGEGTLAPADSDGEEPRPFLRLTGTPEPVELGVPVEALGPLAVAPVPEVPGVESEADSSVRDDDPATAAYRDALAHVRARRFEQALGLFAAFARENPRHPRVGDALYWQGEIHFVLGDYRKALRIFDAVVARFPRGSRAADALLKAGLCHLRQGRPRRAAACFERLRLEHAGSVAASLIPETELR